MNKFNKQINTLKWQILARLPKGSIYERVKESLLNKNITECNPFYYIYWLDLNKSWINKYIFGTYKTDNEDYLKFINWLNDKYAKNEFYEIDVNNAIIKIPKPLLKDYKCFKAEFLDIIMPYLVQNTNQPFLEGPYEYGNVKLNEGDVVLDLGANFGLFSSLASSKNCEVYTFEPTPITVNEYLLRLEKECENIHIINKAVSNVSGRELFNYFKDNSSCNKLFDGNSDNSELIFVDTITVDDFVHQNNISNINFIKADIEGAERLMLLGAKETLKEYGPNLAICYYHKLDDLKILSDLIMDANPKYEIDVAYKKIYASVPGKK